MNFELLWNFLRLETTKTNWGMKKLVNNMQRLYKSIMNFLVNTNLVLKMRVEDMQFNSKSFNPFVMICVKNIIMHYYKQINFQSNLGICKNYKCKILIV